MREHRSNVITQREKALVVLTNLKIHRRKLINKGKLFTYKVNGCVIESIHSEEESPMIRYVKSGESITTKLKSDESTEETVS